MEVDFFLHYLCTPQVDRIVVVYIPYKNALINMVVAIF